MEERVEEHKKITVQKVKDMIAKEIVMYQRMSNIQKSALTGDDLTRDCCKNMKKAHVRRLTGVKRGSEDLYEEDGRLKDPGRWDFRAALFEAVAKVRDQKEHAVFNLD